MQTKQSTLAKFRALSTAQKIQLILALLATAALMIAVPTAAWFNYQRQIVKLQKIQSPDTLILSAAHHEDRMYFKVDGINADENQVDGNGVELTRTVVNDKGETVQEPIKISHKDYVFCVVGEAVDQFTLQLAYTTNNPFIYEVYAAEEFDDKENLHIVSGVEKDYVEYVMQNKNVDGVPKKLLTLEQAGAEDPENDNPEDDGQEAEPQTKTLYYKIDTSVTEGKKLVTPASGENPAVYSGADGQYVGEYLNWNGTFTDNTKKTYDASNKYHPDTYVPFASGAASYDHLHADAEPIYWQATNISAFPGKNNPEKKPFARNFILRVKWEPNQLKNDDKETDIVYITVKATK